MKMVSAAKLRKAQQNVLQMRPYAQKLDEILVNLSSGLDSNEDNLFAKQREVKRMLIVAITSNSGLCGAFNSNVAKQVINLVKNDYSQLYNTGKVDVVTIGKKGMEVLKSKGVTTLKNYNTVYEDLTFEKVSAIALEFMNEFISEKYDKVLFVYNKFRNAASQDLTVSQFLPIQLEEKAGSSTNIDYILEPSKEEIVQELIPRSLKVKLFSILLES
ncbi:MAG: FoF1 ATP synthase subunit gamma, partial [Bacteroidales bacterium]